jgi:hypothetical protein
MLLRQQRIDDAIAVLELNVAAFPRRRIPTTASARHTWQPESASWRPRATGRRSRSIPTSKHARKKLDELEIRADPAPGARR